jgi:serine/threonine protein kinase
MGQVFRARDTKLNRDVALKILPDSFASDAERLQRFEREARTLAALNHPGIAQIYGTIETEGHEALVMEFVPGRTLDQVAVSSDEDPLFAGVRQRIVQRLFSACLDVNRLVAAGFSRKTSSSAPVPAAS